MARHHDAAAEALERLLQALEGLDVEVVGGLVQKQQVAALLQGERQVEAVALATREDTRALLLVLALEAKARHVGAAGNLGATHGDEVVAPAHDLPEGLVGVNAGTVLVDVGDLDALADLELARGDVLEAHDGLEQRGLAHAVGTDDAHDAVARQDEAEIVDEDAVAKALAEVLGLDDLLAQAWTGRNLNLGEVELLGALGLGGHLLVAGKTRLALGLAGLCSRAYPLELALELLGALGVLLALELETGGLLLEVGGVIALIGEELATVDLADPAGHVVKEVAVVRDSHDRTFVAVQELLEPEHGLGVEVVGGLVKEQQVRSLEQQAAQRHATPLATREDGHRSIRVRALKRIHGLAELAVEVPAVGGVDVVLEAPHLVHEGVEVSVGVGHLHADLVEALDLGDDVREGHLDVLANGLVLVELGLLLEKAHRITRREARLAVGDLLDARHDLEQRGLAHAVGTDDANLGTGEDAHRHVIEDDLVAVGLAGLVHLVHELCHGSSYRLGTPLVWQMAQPFGSAVATGTKPPSIRPKQGAHVWAILLWRNKHDGSQGGTTRTTG